MTQNNSHEIAIKVDQVSKRFESQNSSYSFFINGIKKVLSSSPPPTKVLNDISFTVLKGESFGIVGKNGSGKSTLLKMIAGVSSPDSGSIKTYGNLISLLEVGAGFSPLLSGRENIYLNASLNGLSKQSIDSKIKDIISFSGIEASIDKPLYQYSSGMAVRLGFSIAVHSDPDILIVDEALAVGDTNFQGKCIDKIWELKKSGCTLLFVSHDLAMVSGLCDKAMFLNDCSIAALGQASQVVSSYLQFCGDEQSHYALQNKHLKIYFNAGNVGIAYKNFMLTKAHGLYTSVYAYKTWHDSDQIVWNLKKQSNTQLHLVGKMRRVPLYQEWIINITQDNSFEIIIYLIPEHNAKAFSLDEIQVSLLCLPDFESWQTNDQQGKYESTKENLNQWQQLNFSEPSSEQLIQSISQAYGVKLSWNQDTGLKTHATPLITSKELNSSVMQFLYINNNKAFDLNSDKTLFFKGRLSVETK